ncbi:RagB/SusD family nutrient uptake outer membrane protein [Parapedobacter pyrenivorans]|uniref:RagB/SusD family nutrient uptake outer membrane protein n=1 Tax=Parapedobacter pyrenivorans TaxID=1305674 RepID=UPI00333EAAE9
MKNSTIKPAILLLAAALSLNACKEAFLEQPAIGSLSEDVLATESGVNGLLLGAYGALDGSAIGFDPWVTTPMNWIFGDVAGADAHKGAVGGDQSSINGVANFSIDASNGILNAKWTAGYEGITRTNDVLKVLAQVPEGEIDEAAAQRIAAEARFLRAHYYFELRKIFGNIPWIDEQTTELRQPNQAAIWPKIEEDFQYAFNNLPAIQSQAGRVNKWAAAAYLGKTYLYQSKYPEAKAIFDQVITEGHTADGQPYGLVDEYYKVFYAEWKNHRESVFAVQMAVNDGTNDITNANNGNMLNFPFYSPFRCCGFYQPTQDLVNSFKTDATTGLPQLTNYNQDPVKNDMRIAADASFTPYTGSLDPRLDWTVGRRGVPYLDWGHHPGVAWLRDQAYGGPYNSKKNIYWQATQEQYADQSSWAPGTANNVMIIRFADVLLMAAEAEAEAGSLEKAQSYVNLIRARAANPAGWLYAYKDAQHPLDGFSNTPAANYRIGQYPTGTFAGWGKERAKAAIYFERRIELAMEGHRFFDLVRWGNAAQLLNDFFAYESTITTDIGDGHFQSNKNEYFPIPQIQIDRSIDASGNATLIQNPGYN